VTERREELGGGIESPAALAIDGSVVRRRDRGGDPELAGIDADFLCERSFGRRRPPGIAGS
jgi:hypothetical protein